MNPRLAPILLITWMVSPGHAQDIAASFLAAKSDFESGDYRRAFTGFESLVEDEVYRDYALLYSGLSLYGLRKYQEAIPFWLRIRSTEADCDIYEEANYWLGNAWLNTGEEITGFVHLEHSLQIPPKSSNDLGIRILEVLPFEKQKFLFSKFPDSELLAHVLLLSLRKGKGTRSELGRSLSLKMDLLTQGDGSPAGYQPPRDKFSIALLLPFMYSGLTDPSPVINNPLVMDLYQGMNLAREDLERERGIELRFFAFDSKADKAATEKIIPHLQGCDVIIGPLSKEPIEVVSRYSQQYEVPMISPLSENPLYMGSNPHAYLFGSSLVTQARFLADYADGHSRSKTALIYYDSDSRSSEFAASYRKFIEDKDFHVSEFMELDPERTKDIWRRMTDKYNVYFELPSAHHLDKQPDRQIVVRPIDAMERINEVPSFFLDEWELIQSLDTLGTIDVEKALLESLMEIPEERKRVVGYEIRFRNPLDTVDHILLASKASTALNLFSGALGSRMDRPALYSNSNWFDMQVVNYELLETIGIKSVVSQFVDRGTPEFNAFRRKVIAGFQVLPSHYHAVGYEFMYFLGRVLASSRGNLTRELMHLEGFHTPLNQTIAYAGHRDNQEVRIVLLKDLEILGIRATEQSQDDR